MALFSSILCAIGLAASCAAPVSRPAIDLYLSVMMNTGPWATAEDVENLTTFVMAHAYRRVFATMTDGDICHAIGIARRSLEYGFGIVDARDLSGRQTCIRGNELLGDQSGVIVLFGNATIQAYSTITISGANNTIDGLAVFSAAGFDGPLIDVRSSR